MSELTIFKQQGAVSTVAKRELSDLAKSLAAPRTVRSIKTGTNGTFKRVINGEQIGKAIRGEFNAIIVDALPKVSRVFYADKYNPEATKAKLPDCWSNLGDKPEPAAGNPQASNCASCPKNVVGSGENGKGRACRFQRRIALLIAGDDSGDVYQFSVPAKSLFGKGSGNVHPFESYVKFLIANGEGPDTVVTNIAYNLDAETMELQFTPMRGITDEEYALVQAARNDPATRQMIVLTVGAQDTAATAAKAEEAPKPQPKIIYSDEPDDEDEVEVIEEPKKRPAKKAAEVVVEQNDLSSVLNAWGDEDD